MAEKLSRFCGTGTYIASEELQNSVNIAIALGRPLLVKGEPGTGKTKAPYSINFSCTMSSEEVVATPLKLLPSSKLQSGPRTPWGII